MLIPKALDSLCTREPRTLELSWLTSRHVSQSSSPLTTCQHHDNLLFSGDKSNLFQSFLGCCKLVLQTFGHADLWGHEVCDTTELTSQRILLHLSVYSDRELLHTYGTVLF